jgi:hypothetical protein
MSGEVKLPPVYGYATGSYEGMPPSVGPFSLYVDFMFTLWLDCCIESYINVPSSKNVTLLVFVGDASEPIINYTSHEIRHSRNLQANIPCTFQIRNTLNYSLTVVVFTEIASSMSPIATMIGVTLTVTGSVTALMLSRRELKHRKRDSSNLGS